MKKRKACKDCTCGLAEEIAQGNASTQTAPKPTSSCGSVSISYFMLPFFSLLNNCFVKLIINFQLMTIT